jgi:signal transduction histidine kinase
MLNNEKKQWDDYQLEQSLSFTSSTSPEVIRLFGRDVKSKNDIQVYDKNVKEQLKPNNDLIRFMILNINEVTVYESEFYEDFLTDDERGEIKEAKVFLDAQETKIEKQYYKIVKLKSGRKIMDITTPIVHITGRHIFDVRYIISYNSVEKKFNEIKRDFFFITLFTLSFSFLLLFAISKKITNPVFVLTDIVKKMRSGDFNARVENPTNDEIGELSVTFNDMAGVIKEDREAIENTNKELSQANIELKELQEQLLKSERLAALGQLAAGISHEIDNPIGIILGYAEYIKSELEDASPINDEIDSIINESKRCRRIVGGLLNFAKTSPSHIEEYDLNDIAKETVSAVSLQSLFKLIKIKEDYDHDIPTIMLDRDKIKQVLINLLINAAQAIEDEGEIAVSTKLTEKEGKRFIDLYISDTGAGIAQKDLGRIFDPFFTTKTHGKGTGLGLSICQKLIEEQKGTIFVESNEKEGTTFTITFPVEVT